MEPKAYLKETRQTITGFAEKVGVTREHLSSVFNGLTLCSAKLAILIEEKSNHMIDRSELRPDLFDNR